MCVNIFSFHNPFSTRAFFTNGKLLSAPLTLLKVAQMSAIGLNIFPAKKIIILTVYVMHLFLSATMHCNAMAAT